VSTLESIAKQTKKQIQWGVCTSVLKECHCMFLACGTSGFKVITRDKQKSRGLIV